MRPEDNHTYEIAPRTEPTGSWGVYCAGCSYVSQTYVYPCRFKADHEDTPPQILLAQEKVQDMLNEVLTAMVNDGKALLAPPGKVIVHNAGEYRFVDAKVVIPKLVPFELSFDLEPNAFGESLHVVPKEDTDG